MGASIVAVCILFALYAKLEMIRGEGHFHSSHVDFRFNHQLDVPASAMQQSTFVDNIMSCVETCVNLGWCKSGNLKTTPESNGLHTCEVFSSDEYHIGNRLMYNQDYRHFRLVVSEYGLSLHGFSFRNMCI